MPLALRKPHPAQLELIYHYCFPWRAPKTGLLPKGVATARACFPTFQTFQNLETNSDLELLVYFQILKRRNLESLES